MEDETAMRDGGGGIWVAWEVVDWYAFGSEE